MSEPMKSVHKRSTCPVAGALDLFGDRWSLLVVRDLAAGKRQFKELSASPEGIASNILSERLLRLAEAGIVEKYVPPDLAGRPAYRLTQKGNSLAPVLASLAGWGLAHIPGTRRGITPRFTSG